MVDNLLMINPRLKQVKRLPDGRNSFNPLDRIDHSQAHGGKIPIYLK
jgi:hypothetical protein